MTEALCILAGFALGFAASTLLALRNLRRMRDARDAARAQAAQQARAVAQMREREAAAAANIVQLCGVVHAQQTLVSVPPPVKIWLN